MRVKTSITLPKELLSRLDRVDKNRSALIERAALAYLARLEREKRFEKWVYLIPEYNLEQILKRRNEILAKATQSPS